MPKGSNEFARKGPKVTVDDEPDGPKLVESTQHLRNWTSAEAPRRHNVGGSVALEMSQKVSSTYN